jgi:PKD repeat protein
MLLGLLQSNVALAQFPEGSYHPCATSELYRIQLQKQPHVRALEHEFNQWANVYRHQQEQLKSGLNKTQEEYSGSKYIIPCVVHVIHSGSGQPDSISVEQVKSMFLPLFNDLRRVPGTRGYGTGVDTKIEFSLATKDPKGNPTVGVNYVKDAVLTNVIIDSDSMGILPGEGNTPLKSLIRWDSTKYANFWIVRRIRTVSSDSTQWGIAGYAQYPWYPSPPTDGMVVAYPFWGVGAEQKYTSTTTHEIGHWLALIHPFDSAGTDGCMRERDCQTWGDKTCDVPPTAPVFKRANFRINSCDNDGPDVGGHDWPDFSLNYMDYTDPSEFPNHYSHGQTLRSHAVLDNNDPKYMRRNRLWAESNLEATGTGPYAPPMANFWASQLKPCANAPIRFIDYTHNRPTTYLWTFEGGDPATSTDAYPTVRFPNPGKYDVQLIVSNFSGKSDTILKADFIEVVQRPAIKVGEVQSFADTTFPPIGWTIDNPDALNKPGKDRNVGWQRNKAFGAEDRTSAVMPLFQYDDYFQKDALISPFIDLTGNLPFASLQFDYSYRPIRHFRETVSMIPGAKSRLYGDTLSVWASVDCGANWIEIFKRGGEALTSGLPTIEADRLPQRLREPEVWKRQLVSLDTFLNRSDVQIKFETINGWGNDLYLDNIQIVQQDVATRINPYAAPADWTVYPNPTTGLLNLRFTPIDPMAYRLELLDMNGKIVLQHDTKRLSPNQQQITLSLEHLRAGVYQLITRTETGSTWANPVIVLE